MKKLLAEYVPSQLSHSPFLKSPSIPKFETPFSSTISPAGLVSDPGFKTSTLKSIFERNQIRKQKINKILKNPLK